MNNKIHGLVGKPSNNRREVVQSANVHIKVTPEVKRAWVDRRKKDGYRTLSAWIKDKLPI